MELTLIRQLQPETTSTQNKLLSMHKHMQLFSTDSGAYWVSKLVRAYFNEWGDKHDRVEPFHCNFQTGPPGIAQMSRWPVRHGTDSTRKIYATSLSHIIYANCSCQNLLHPPLYLPHSFLFSLTFPIAYIIPSICFCSPFHCPELPQPISHRESTRGAHSFSWILEQTYRNEFQCLRTGQRIRRLAIT